MLLCLQKYNLELQYKKGNDMHVLQKYKSVLVWELEEIDHQAGLPVIQYSVRSAGNS
jgi:hypothetical protein